ncbi:hypothetical protein CFP56_014882 [Quercus suber]|uniref:Uncharacterized protein n=1 Tax=Quercus suber TaxID=58331 RepID=A0AAW0KQX3_QUESU
MGYVANGLSQVEAADIKCSRDGIPNPLTFADDYSFVLLHDLPLPQTHHQPQNPGQRKEKSDFEPPKNSNQGSATLLPESEPQSPSSLG